MKILLINGSPKKENSDTLKIANAFLAGMREEGEQEITTVHVYEKHIEYCTGCFECLQKNTHCIFNDDMGEILELIPTCDVLMFNYPLYTYGMPAKMKCFADRMLPLSKWEVEKKNGKYFHPSRVDLSHQKTVLILGCGFPSGKLNFDAAITQFKFMFPENSTVITVPESPLFAIPSATLVTVPKLRLVTDAGREFAKSGAVKEELLDKISLPMIPEETYMRITNGR